MYGEDGSFLFFLSIVIVRSGERACTPYILKLYTDIVHAILIVGLLFVQEGIYGFVTEERVCRSSDSFPVGVERVRYR